MRKCLNCNNDFEPKSDKQKFCDNKNKCRVAYWRKQNKKEGSKKTNIILPEWMKRVEDYCSNAGIMPDDLIETHKEVSKIKFTKAKAKDFDGKKASRNKLDEVSNFVDEVKEKVVHKKVSDKSIEPEPGTNAYFLRHGHY